MNDLTVLAYTVSCRWNIHAISEYGRRMESETTNKGNQRKARVRKMRGEGSGRREWKKVENVKSEKSE